jgi:putative transposase
MPSHWPHSPSHTVDHPGSYIVTSATYKKHGFFNSDEKLDMLESVLLETLAEVGWQVQAWSVFSNHYHFVGLSPEDGLGLTQLCRRIHGQAAKELNRMDGAPGRMVWYRTWDTRITFEKSYLARLAYVHNNPVKHGLANQARDYKWCSAAWLIERGDRPFVNTILSFKTDQVNVYDDF